MDQEITIETSLKAIALFGYILIIVTGFLILVGAGVGEPVDVPDTEYHRMMKTVDD